MHLSDKFEIETFRRRARNQYDTYVFAVHIRFAGGVFNVLRIILWEILVAGQNQILRLFEIGNVLGFHKIRSQFHRFGVARFLIGCRALLKQRFHKLLVGPISGKSEFLKRQRHRHDAAINILCVNHDNAGRPVLGDGATNVRDFAAVRF